jgi:SPP1 family predicted phage head-tail adaptor
MSLAAGRLRHRVRLERKVAGEVDTHGDTMPSSWELVAETWAEVRPLSAREFVAAQSVQSLVSAKITIRSREIDATMRIVHRGKVYNIAGVLPDDWSGQEYITLPVSEGTNQG